MRQITIKYAGDCRRCGNPLEVGQAAMYEKSQGIFCLGCEPKDAEEVRQYRTLKAEARADQLIGKAERLEADASRRAAPMERMRGDTAFFTQPGRIPYRDRIFKAYDRAGELFKEARQARERAEGVMIYKTRVAGDAEKRRQAERGALDAVILKGSRVNDPVFGEGEVLGVFKKSYRIKFDRGFTYARDKSYVRPI